MALDLVTHSKIQKLPREHALVMNVVVIHPRTAIPCQSLHLEAMVGKTVLVWYVRVSWKPSR